MENHLIVGLGGTGGKILRAFRKILFQELRETKEIDKLNIGYLYVDSNAEMMAIDDPSWKLFGTSVQLGKSSQVHIKGADLKNRLQEVDSFPQIKHWIGDAKEWNDVFEGIMGDAVGGQRRRLGRFLFTCNVNEFLDKLKGQAKLLREKSGISETTFHVCCGLAGGTGSGTIVDVITQIRKTFPADSGGVKNRIITYTLLPDANPKPNWDTGNYHANGYAALMELNALSTGSLIPHDVSGENDGRKITGLINPFNGCYIFTNENENGREIDVHTMLPNVVADFLYQKVVVAGTTEWKAESLDKIENAENGKGDPEMDQEYGEAKERSKRFITFGIKRLMIPEEEIQEYLTFSFARQAVLQLRYNHWSDEIGYMDEFKSQNFSEVISQKDTLENLLLSDDHLTLSVGILEQDKTNKRWKKISVDWETVIGNFKTDIRENDKQKEGWLDKLEKLCHKRFDEDFRGLGVKKFYETKNQDRKEIAREVRRKVEQALFDEWRVGQKSMYDLDKYLDTLLTYLNEKLIDFDTKITRKKDSETAKEAERKSNHKTWANVGFMSSMFGKHDKLFDDHAIILQYLFCERTMIEAFSFAKGLLFEVRSQLNDLKSEVSEAALKIDKITEKFASEMNARCKGEDWVVEMKKQNVRLFESDLVKVTTNSFERNFKQQQKHSNEVRQKLVAEMGEKFNFANFNERFTESYLSDVLQQISLKSAIMTHNEEVTEKKKKLIGQNILEKLSIKYPQEHDLKKFIHELVSLAGNYLRFNAQEESIQLTKGVKQQRVVDFAVIMPDSDSYQDYLKQLEKLFLEENSNMKFIKTKSRMNEITIISLSNLFPLRFVDQVAKLRNKYQMRIKLNDVKQAKLVLHIEGDGSNYPPLFLPNAEDIAAKEKRIKQNSIAYLLLAKQMELLQIVEHPATGVKMLALIGKDEDGLDLDPIFMDKTLVKSVDKVNTKIYETISQEITQKLATTYLHETKRETLKKGVIAELEVIKEEVGGNLTEVYRQFNEGAKNALKLLKREE